MCELSVNFAYSSLDKPPMGRYELETRPRSMQVLFVKVASPHCEIIQTIKTLSPLIEYGNKKPISQERHMLVNDLCSSLCSKVIMPQHPFEFYYILITNCP